MGVGIGALAAVAIGAAGAGASAYGTSQAQSSANRASALAAAQQSAASFQNYLSSRGVNLPQLVAKYPDLQAEYTRAHAAGDKRDFNSWLYAALAAAPNHPIWNDISNPSIGNGAQNTSLPAWAVDANGNPLQPSILQQLVGIQSGANNPATAPAQSIATLDNIHKLITAHPELAKQVTDQPGWQDGREDGGTGRSVEEWLRDHIGVTEAGNGGGTFTDALRSFLTTPPAAGTPGAAGPAGTGNTKTIDPAIAALIPGATSTAAGIFDGSYLQKVLTALKPVQDARSQTADLQAQRIKELQGLSGNVLSTELGGIAGVKDARTTGAAGILGASEAAANGVYQANVDKLASLLGVRREAAQQIYDASAGAAGGVRDARTKGASDIYGADLLSADTYAQANEQSLARLMAQQTAERARRGFSGGSSGSDIVRARLTADALQKGAGARAAAGQALQGRLSDTGIGYATDIGRAGVGRATTIGQSNEADAAAKLAASVDLARQLGLARTTNASTLAGVGESDAVAQLQAKLADAQRRLGYVTTDADIAKAQADQQNAQDALNALIADQGRATGSISLPFNLAGADLALKNNLNDQQYSDLDALLKRLQGFQISQAGGPQLTTPQTGSVLNPAQVWGAALSGGASALGSGSNSNDLMALIRQIGAGSSTTPNTASNSSLTTPTNTYAPLVGSGNYLAKGSVFGPG